MGLARKRDRRYSYKDYLTLPDEERWEIVDGTAYNMSPAPTVKHQNIVSNLHIALKTSPANSCYTGINYLSCLTMKSWVEETMKKEPWLQKAKASENPYLGKDMLLCGNEIKY